MKTVATILIGISALGFLLAVISALSGVLILGVGPEGFSRTCSNMALIAIALGIWIRGKETCPE